MSDFGLSIAASGLNADTAELDTASNNLSNINTPGYAQEVVNLSPEAAAGPLEAGRGVTVASVSELTDAVYESANVAAEGVQGAASQTNQVMTSIESVFPEPSSDGLSAQLSTFWSDLSTLAANPNQAGAQQTVAADANGLAEALNTTSTQLSDLSASLQSEVGTGSADSGNPRPGQRAPEPGGPAESGDRCRRLGRSERQRPERRATIGGRPTGRTPRHQHVHGAQTAR